MASFFSIEPVRWKHSIVHVGLLGGLMTLLILTLHLFQAVLDHAAIFKLLPLKLIQLRLILINRLFNLDFILDAFLPLLLLQLFDCAP